MWFRYESSVYYSSYSPSGTDYQSIGHLFLFRSTLPERLPALILESNPPGSVSTGPDGGPACTKKGVKRNYRSRLWT